MRKSGKRFGGMLAAMLLMAGAAHAEVHLPNGEYRETVEDIKVKVLGGFVTVSRTWQADNLNKGQFRWYLNPAWADLTFDIDVIDGKPTKITRAGTDFERTGNGVYVFDKQYFIQQTFDSGGTETGWKWFDRLGNWITYGLDRKVIAYGDRNNVAVHFVRDASGRIATITDNANRTILTYGYDGDQVNSITDYTGRAVHYTYSGGALTDVADVLGHTWHYAYAAGLMHTRTDPEGRVTTIDYSGNRVVRITDPPDTDASGNAVTYVTTYDYAYDRGKAQYTVIARTPGNQLTTSRYDADGRLIHQEVGTRVVTDVLHDGPSVDIFVDERGLRTRTEFDAYRNPVKVTNPDGTQFTTVYDGAYNLPLTRTDELGVVSSYEYDSNGKLLRLKQALGRPEQTVTEYSYDAETGARLTETVLGPTSDENATTTWTYDDYGNIRTITDAENHTQTYEYDAQGNVTKRTDARGKIWTNTINAAGWLTAKKDPETPGIVITYDKVGNRISAEDAEHQTTLYTYTTHNLLRSVTDPLGGTTAYEYSRDDRQISKTDPNGIKTEFDYDADGRLISSVDGAGNRTELAYGRKCDDSAAAGQEGMLTAISYPTYCEEYAYDQRGARTSITRILPGDGGASAARQTTSYGYDARSQLVSETNPLGRTTQRTRDALGRVVSAIDSLGGTTTYAYDTRGNLTSVTDANNHRSAFGYDKADRMRSETRPLGQTTHFDYDESGNLASRVSPNGERRDYGYDDSGRKISEKQFAANASSPSQTITYDLDGRGLLAGYQQSGDTTSSAAYVYDGNGQKLHEAVTYGSGAGAIVKSLHYEYEASGLKTKIVYPDGREQTSTYDHNRLATITIQNVALQYKDYNWRVPTQIVMPGATRTLQYDPLQRALAAKSQAIGTGTQDAPNGPVVMDYHYAYDAVGNISTRTTEDGSYQYSYDALNRLAGVTPPSVLQQNAGNPNGLPIEQYTYDAVDNRLSSAHQPGPWVYDANNELSSSGSADRQITFVYDSNGNPIQRRLGNPDAPMSTREYVYNAAGRVSEIKDDGATIASYRYDPFGRRILKEDAGGAVWFLYGDEGLVAEYSDTGVLQRSYGWMPDGLWGTDPVWEEDGSGLQLAHNDHMGSSQRLTDVNGNVTWRSTEQAFGQRSTVGAVTNPQHLAGQYYDDATGTYYNRFRDYDAQLGRYIEIDYDGLARGLNSYSYANQNPLTNTDPFGLFCIPWFSEKRDWQQVGPPRTDRSHYYDGVAFTDVTGAVSCRWPLYNIIPEVRLVRPQSLCLECSYSKEFFCSLGVLSPECVWKIVAGQFSTEKRERRIDISVVTRGAPSANYGTRCATCMHPVTKEAKTVCEGEPEPPDEAKPPEGGYPRRR